MAENVFTKYGGKVQYTPERVKSDISAPYEYTDEDQIRQLAVERDLTAANLLENDVLLDALDDAIDDQMKEFALTVPELYDAASNLCGSPTVTWECYKKAKELLRIAPWITNGYDPVQLTFTDKFVKRSGNVVFDCKQFDPNKFHDSKEQQDALDNDIDNQLDVETPSEIEKKARENQKKWSLLILFWDLLWGKPAVKPGIPDDIAKNKMIEEVNNEIQKLKSEGKDTEADALSKRLTQSENLPNTVMVDRPRNADQLQWQGKNNIVPDLLINKQNSIWISPLATGKPWVEDAAAIWVDFISLFGDVKGHKGQDYYKNRSIPALKSGFILSILVGFCSLIPKICFFFISKRIDLLKSIKFVKRVPIVGNKLFNLIKGFINLIICIPILLSNLFIEICIWLCMLPQTYIPNVSDLEPLPNTTPSIPPGMEVLPTPAGFISMDCFTAAQEIVNRVNQESVN